MSRTQWRSQGGGGGTGAMAPPKLLVVNFSINLRCYVLLGCRVINVILAINIGDSAFFDIAALVNSVVYGITSRRNRYIGPPQTKILATPLRGRAGSGSSERRRQLVVVLTALTLYCVFRHTDRQPCNHGQNNYNRVTNSNECTH